MDHARSDDKLPAVDTHDVITSASQIDLESIPENVPLKILPGHGPRPISRRNDSASSRSTPTSSPAQSNTSLDREHARSPLAREYHDTRPRWLNQSTTRGKQRIESIAKSLRILPVVKWANGPSPPRPYKINPLFPRLQSLPTTFLSRYAHSPVGDIILTCLLCVLWLITFSVILAESKPGTVAGPGSQSAVRLDCTTQFWGRASACGVDGVLCQPFEGASFPFICPANCAGKQVLEPHTVGDQEIIYRSFVIGGQRNSSQGQPIYRGDSFICAAAVHAGIVSDTRGGCGTLNREGTQSGYTSTTSNGITSISFDPSFPLSFSLSPSDIPSIECSDLQWALFGVSLGVTIFISLVATPPALFFTSIFVIAFFQTALASDSTYFPDFASVISLAFERFLPAAFVAVVLYRYCIRRTLTGMKAYWERTVLWVGGCWVGALNDYTFDQIPISRLTPHDLKQQPGAIVALIIILAVILLAAIGQVWAFRIEGRLPRYLGFYLVIAVIIGCLIAVPGLNFRLHHYIIGLLLLPGTSIQTRPSLLYQGILVGLFINGVARWGFASILQTSNALRGDGQLGSALPTDLAPAFSADTVAFTISKLAEGFDGLSILVNDVERYQQTNVSLPAVFNWTRSVAGETAFFRFAYTGTYTLGGIFYGDYTKPGTWFGNGTWIDMLPGPSK